MTSRLVLLCACLQVVFLVSANNTLHENDSNHISEEKSESLRKEAEIKESFDNPEDEILVRATEDIKSNVDLHETGSDRLEGPGSLWLNVPILPIVYATSPSLPDGPCKKQALRYLRDLRNETLWATQMYDASTTYPHGIISGQTRHLGDFDLCYNLKVTLPLRNDDESLAKEDITGRYCLVDIDYEKQGLPPVDPLKPHELQFDPQGSVWEAIREKGDFRRIKRYMLQMALCVPEVCTAADIEMALREPFAQAGIKQNVNFNVTVKPHFCQARKDAPEFSLGSKIYCSVLVSLLLFVILCTWYDYSLEKYEEKDGLMANDLLLCFSARRNFNSIMEVTKGHPGLDTIHLIRFFLIVLTIVGHRFMEFYATPMVNWSYIEWLYTFRISMVLFAGPLVIEQFFSIGGLLLSYQMLGQLDKKKKMNFLGPILIRFLRLTPSYALVVLFNIFVLPYIGSGPYWKWKIDLERDSCASNWWANLLYINNYVNPEKICLFQSWYVAVDYHLFILALLVTYAFWRMPRKIGYPFLCLIIFGGCIVPFVNTYSYGVQPIFKGLPDIRELRDNLYFTKHYVKTHERITSYFIGVLIGAVLYDHNRNPWRLSKVTSNILFILFVIVLSIGSQLTLAKFYDPNRNPGGLEAALHAAFQKAVFTIAFSSIIVLISVGQGLTFHYKFFTPRWVQPLGRLTYGTYLVHSVIQLYGVGVTRAPKQFGFQIAIRSIIVDVIYSFCLAFLLCLSVEGPFRRIEKRFITKREKSEPSNEVKTKDKKTN